MAKVIEIALIGLLLSVGIVNASESNMGPISHSGVSSTTTTTTSTASGDTSMDVVPKNVMTDLKDILLKGAIKSKYLCSIQGFSIKIGWKIRECCWSKNYSCNIAGYFTYCF